MKTVKDVLAAIPAHYRTPQTTLLAKDAMRLGSAEWASDLVILVNEWFTVHQQVYSCSVCGKPSTWLCPSKCRECLEKELVG